MVFNNILSTGARLRGFSPLANMGLRFGLTMILTI